ncbi:unnamed protein product [Adineta ricciae]|uniref:Ubiquitin-like domain-containing protein n=1 Tax=Adineta ricciae TaxID=249248 RepID=A0A816H8S5_ADIRI|nr:unnamed protein product [Adineta ricciae]
MEQDDKPPRYFDLIEKHGNLKPLADISIRAPYLIQVHLVYNQVTYDKEIDVRQTVQQFKKYLQNIFHIPSNRLRVFYVDDVAFNMGFCGPEELKYPQRLLHTYNIHDGDQFHIDVKPDYRKPQPSNQSAHTARRIRKKSTDNSPNSSFSSTSSEDDKISLPFSFDSLQKLSNQKDIDLHHQTFVQLDQLYPSIEKVSEINDDDDDLLSAAAMACNQMKKN